MAEENKEKYSIDFQTNADAAAKDVQGLRASIEQSTEATKKNTAAGDAQEEQYKSFKTQLREANQELQKSIQIYGETSAEAVKAAKGVADLKDQMGFAKDLADTFNPDQKFKALGAATQVAGTGLQGVTAGMALFGGESEDTQKQLLKVQAAMAFSDAISSLSNIGDQFAILKTTVKNTWTALTTAKAVDTAVTATNTGAQVANATAVVAETEVVSGSTVATTAATIATNLWNASLAIALAPITLITAGVAGLVLGIGYLTGAFGDFSGEQLKAEVANKKLSNSIEAQEKAFAKSNKQLELSQSLAIGMAKASGKSAVEIRNLENALINQEVAEKRLNAVKMQSIFIEARRIAGLEDATDAQKETAKKAYDSFVKANEVFNTSLDKRKQLVVAHEIEKRQIETESAEKLADAKEKIKEKARTKKDAKAKEEADALKKIADDKLADEMKSAQDAVNIIEQLKQNVETPAQKETREFEEKKLVLEANNVSTEELYASHLAKLSEIERLEREKKTEEENEYWASESDKAVKRTADEKVISDAKLAQKKSEQDSLAALGNAGINAAKDLFGKNKAVQKGIIATDGAVALGKVAINTIDAVSKDNAASPLTFGMPWSGVHIATGALGAASIIANTTKALQAVGGGSAPSAGAVPSAPSGVSAAPQTGFQASSENQIATSISNQQNQTPIIKTYVVGSEVTTAQSLDAKLIQQNSFG